MKQKLFLCFLFAAEVLMLLATDGYSYPEYADCQTDIECGICHNPSGIGAAAGYWTFCEFCPNDPSCATTPQCTVDADCDDGLFCNGAETCDAGTCVSGTPPDCNDGIDCTVDTCDEANDNCVSTPDDAVCDDGDVCNGIETCDFIFDCQAGTPLDCNDGELCTTDSCDAVTGCSNVPVDCPAGQECNSADGQCYLIPECTDDAQCDNGFFCDGVEICDAGTCISGTPPDCDDGVNCTVDTCDETNDVCVNTPDDAVCDDGSVCTGTETCDPINDCQAGTPLDCDDGDLCTTDSCDALTGCANVPVDCPAGQECNSADGQCYPIPQCTDDAQCDNGFFCDGAEICDAGTCVSGTPPDCDDGVNCTVDTCDETNDVCVNTPDDTSCDDNDVCTGTETCDPINDCQAGTPLDCDDGDLCTIDSCDSLTGCANVPVDCPAGQECNSADGQCYPIPGCTDDADCDNGFFCDGAEICDAGTCVSGTPPDCDDGVNCTVDTCDETNDVCVNTPDDLSCSVDGLFCTGQEVCDPSSGCVSTGDTCPEGTTCNEDTDTCDVVSRKVTICHIPSGNPAKARTLLIDANAVAAHLRHGDFLGTCP